MKGNQMKIKLRWGTLSALAFTLAIGFTTAAEANDFYKGKTIRLIVATTPGGGFDAYSRMLSRHMSKHIPGNPAFVVENMPGRRFSSAPIIYTSKPSRTG